MPALLLRARNSGIGHLYLRANSLNDRDDRERNACGDQAVFNCVAAVSSLENRLIS
jgi:hypothetical protein